MSKVKLLFYENSEFLIFRTSFQFLEATKILVLSERKSFMTMTYIVLIMIAYFGPNAKHLGNIQLEIWHFDKSIEDIYQLLCNKGQSTLGCGFPQLCH